MSGWDCPNRVDNNCKRVADRPCKPGMKGCVLFKKYRFASNDPRKEKESMHKLPSSQN